MRYNECSPEELAQLPEDQIERLIELECAHEGTGLLPACPEAPAKPQIAPDVTVYQLHANTTFVSREDAEKVLRFIQDHTRVGTRFLRGGWSGPTATEPVDDDEGRISEVKHYSPAHYARHSKDLERYDVLKEEYDKLSREYNKAAEARRSVVKRVREAVDDARDLMNTRRRIRDTFNEYVSLADGDEDMALAFILKAGRFNEDLVRDVLGKPKEQTDGEEAAGQDG